MRWNMHPNLQALDAEIEGMNIHDTQYAVANKIPYKQLKQQKQLNKATIEGRAHGAAGQERREHARIYTAPPKNPRLRHDNWLDYREGSEQGTRNKA